MARMRPRLFNWLAGCLPSREMGVNVKYGITGLDMDFPDDWDIVRIEKRHVMT